MSESLKKYLKKYIDINSETIQKAAQEDPELLVELFVDKSLRPLTRAIILHDLGAWARDEHWDLCVKSLDDEQPLIRESAAMSLFQYARRENNPKQEAKLILENKLQTEKSAGVIKQFKSCIESIEFYSE